MANASPPESLTSILSRYKDAHVPENRPLVTLTFAQSLDAKIAGKNGKQLIISGKESMIMTHWMRTMHDAILIGIGTALNDDPQLNARHLQPPLDGARRHLPRPVIIDTQLKLPPTCKLLRNYQNGQGRRPWVVCTADTGDAGWCQRREDLEKSGATIIPVPQAKHGKFLRLPTILTVLRRRGIRTLMVEGGAQIIGSFFAEIEESIIDSIIITVAPTFVGSEGVGYGVQLHSEIGPKFEHVRSDQVGGDTVVSLISITRQP